MRVVRLKLLIFCLWSDPRDAVTPTSCHPAVQNYLVSVEMLWVLYSPLKPPRKLIAPHERAQKVSSQDSSC